LCPFSCACWWTMRDLRRLVRALRDGAFPLSEMGAFLPIAVVISPHRFHLPLRCSPPQDPSGTPLGPHLVMKERLPLMELCFLLGTHGQICRHSLRPSSLPTPSCTHVEQNITASSPTLIVRRLDFKPALATVHAAHFSEVGHTR
jgi:hypothetical protein